MTERRAVVSVMLPREHLPFVREWCEHHAAQGWETFIYENSGSVGSLRKTSSFNRSQWTGGRSDKRGTDYSKHSAHLSDAEVLERLRDEVRGLPVTIVPWHPTDADGAVIHGQVEAYVDFIRRHRGSISWGAFLDADEYLECGAGLAWDQLFAEAMMSECDRILIAGELFEHRWSPQGEPLERRRLRSCGTQDQANKNIVRLQNVLRADVHWGWRMDKADRRLQPDARQFFFRHYRETVFQIRYDVKMSPLGAHIDESIPVEPLGST